MCFEHRRITPTPTTHCSCGEPITLECERDEGRCVDCQAEIALRGMEVPA